MLMMSDDDVLLFLSDLGDLVSEISYSAYKRGVDMDAVRKLEKFQEVSQYFNPTDGEAERPGS